jgi:mevalonate kinase
MPAFTATAPGKIILFGEHAVVYGKAAIASPILCYQARTIVTPELNSQSGNIHLEAEDIGLSSDFDDLDHDHPLRTAILQVLEDIPPNKAPACHIKITSTIPQSSGLGSGAGVAASLIQAFSAFLGQRLTDEQISQKTYQVEKIHHGTPSGIDNTVVSYQKPIFFRQNEPLLFLNFHSPITILIADSGKPGNTHKAVDDVRQQRISNPAFIDSIFNSIDEISNQAFEFIKTNSNQGLGPLMNQNHQLLRELGVSSPELDHLVNVARDAGALGAKMSGGGLGGHIIALIENQADRIIKELIAAGATSAMITTLSTD